MLDCYTIIVWSSFTLEDLLFTACIPFWMSGKIKDFFKK